MIDLGEELGWIGEVLEGEGAVRVPGQFVADLVAEERPVPVEFLRRLPVEDD